MEVRNLPNGQRKKGDPEDGWSPGKDAGITSWTRAVESNLSEGVGPREERELTMQLGHRHEIVETIKQESAHGERVRRRIRSRSQPVTSGEAEERKPDREESAPWIKEWMNQ